MDNQKYFLLIISFIIVFIYLFIIKLNHDEKNDKKICKDKKKDKQILYANLQSINEEKKNDLDKCNTDLSKLEKAIAELRSNIDIRINNSLTECNQKLRDKIDTYKRLYNNFYNRIATEKDINNLLLT